jgi:cytochrome c-type biogenesis protein CcmH/NrfG
VQLDPRDAKTHFLLAKTFSAEGNWAAAKSAIEKAIELNPAQPEFLVLREQLARHSR